MAQRPTSIVAVSCLLLAGCGTTVPEIAEFSNGSQARNNQLVQAIIVSVRCELEDAVTDVINAARHSPDPPPFYKAFLEKWGAQVALTLRLDEKTAVSPSALSHIPSSVFTLTGGVSGSAEATRIDIINFYAKVSDLYLGVDQSGASRKCARDTVNPGGSLLIQSDLKLREWLDAMVLGVNTGVITKVSDKNVLSHEVSFDVVTGADINPAWAWANGAVNQRGLFLTASRDRKHDLILTFGPIDMSNRGSFLIPIAENTHEYSQLANSINSGTQNAVR